MIKRRMRAEERRLKTTVRTGMVSVEDELDMTRHVEAKNVFEQVLQEDIGTSFKVPARKIQHFSPPPTTQEEVRRSPFRKAF